MKDYIHGFNNFDLKNFGVKEYHNGTLKNFEIFRELLNLPAPELKKSSKLSKS